MKKFLLILTLCFCFSCQNVEKVEKPENLIPEDKMVNVLTELSLLNAAKSYNLKQLQNSGLKPTQYIYTKFEIDSLQFARSNRYYSDNIEHYQNIYARVKDSLENMKNKYDSILNEERQRKDSIKINSDIRNEIDRDSLFRLRRRQVEESGLLPMRENRD